jgi:hypothetical protein
MTVDVQRHQPFEPLEICNLFGHTRQNPGRLRSAGHHDSNNDQTDRQENTAHRTPNGREIAEAYHRPGGLKRSVMVMVSG